METLDEHLDRISARADVAATFRALAGVGADLSRLISRGRLGGALGGAPGEAMGENADGDRQIALDVAADEAFARALAGGPVRFLASEEQEAAAEINPAGALALAIDPLDGSSNAEVNVSIGTIFAIFPAEGTAEASFLRPGREQVGAGYMIYGPQTALVFTLGAGVHVAILNRDSGVFVVLDERAAIPPQSSEFAINASNYRHWPKPVRSYIDDCVAGQDGPRGRNFNMRWVASLVAEAHRIMMRGGIFLYPADARKGYEQGRLRLLYECAPIAFLAEQAGGGATDGTERILDKSPAHLHARTPFVFGSAEKVARVTAYHDLPESETSPLFGRRGLFQA